MSDAVRELDNFNFREQQCNNDDYGASGKSSIISSRVFTGLDRPVKGNKSTHIMEER